MLVCSWIREDIFLTQPKKIQIKIHRQSSRGTLSWTWLPLTQTAHHPWTTFPIMHCTHTFPSTITPITQLSPFTHHSDCLTTPAPHSLTHIKAAHKHSPSAIFLFCPGYISERSSPYLLSLCVTPDCLTLDFWTCACDLDPCLVLFTSLLCLWSSCFCLLTIACLILPPLNKYWCNWIRMPQTPSLQKTSPPQIQQHHLPYPAQLWTA